MGSAAAATGAILQGGGAILGIDANNKQARAQKRAARAQARLQNLQADERERQLGQELDIFETQGELAFGDAVSTYAKSGVNISGSPLMVLANTSNEITTQKEEMRRKGTKEVELMRQGALDLRRSATRFGNSDAANFGTLLTSAGSIVSKFGEE